LKTALASAFQPNSATVKAFNSTQLESKTNATSSPKRKETQRDLSEFAKQFKKVSPFSACGLRNNTEVSIERAERCPVPGNHWKKLDNIGRIFSPKGSERQPTHGQVISRMPLDRTFTMHTDDVLKTIQTKE